MIVESQNICQKNKEKEGGKGKRWDMAGKGEITRDTAVLLY